jgi:ABC-type xylose transport system permease subunit
MQLVDFTPITGSVAELSMVTASFIGGTYVRDITAP